MIKTLLKSMRQYKKVSWATIFFSTFEVVFEKIIPLCMSGLIDNGIEGGVMSKVWKYGLALLFLAVIQMVTGMLAAFLGSRASAGFGANLRSDMYDNVQTFAFSNIDKFSTASIVTRLTTDVTNIQNAYQMLIRIAIRGPVMLIFAMIVSFRIDSQISLMFIAIIPVLATLLVLIIIKVNPVFKRVIHTYDELNNVVQENVRGIRVDKTIYQEDQEDIREDIQRLRKSGAPYCAQLAYHAGLHVYLHDTHLMARRKGGHRQRQQRSTRSDHRLANRAVHLRHADTHEPHDALHGLCHDDNRELFRSAYS